ncbi:hypothetical protein DFA_03567 [Cavenderia fasciculata]|uniref:Aminotransferase class I/classII large domain-containing protein n=1 Tax=Cavenderia fasciculata TaxID=261658 RepID=F4PI35_CACFS|nr:uncharacterized protein DFA_03567 [Cavenderia fasciculata]EGG25318.1 hypothetical protein DFA_03567 [Cavenderia fasciculata]|eukprot:XP_004363169.1 hypothetical protein DFA_03567 [Cavenderia fasciculata]
MEANNSIKDYSKFYGSYAKLRKPSPIRELFKYTVDPSIISLGGGLPNPNAFPFKKITVELKDGEPLEIQGDDLSNALQYTQTYGLPKFTAWLKNLQIRNHKLPAADNKERPWNVGVTSGSQEGLALVFSSLLDQGDSIIIESPTYSGTLSILGPMGLNMAGIQVDKNGMIPSLLENVLENWDTLYPGKRFPKLIYTIPTGQNPSGCSMTVERKRTIYKLCSKYDLLILEDDPYFYLQFEMSEEDKAEGLVVEPGQPILGVSFLSMDTDQRVIRFDSLSKILSSGLRIGFVTGPFKLLEVMQNAQQASTLHASGVSQTIALSLLQKWGIDGFHQHIVKVQAFYRERRAVFLGHVETHLKGLVEYVSPSAGMFVWFRVLNTDDTYQMITSKAIEKKVVLVPGIAFDPNPEVNLVSPYVRASFSIATDEQMEEACKRFASLLQN